MGSGPGQCQWRECRRESLRKSLFCSLHNEGGPPNDKCQGATKAGRLCGRTVPAESKLCHDHARHGFAGVALIDAHENPRTYSETLKISDITEKLQLLKPEVMKTWQVLTICTKGEKAEDVGRRLKTLPEGPGNYFWSAKAPGEYSRWFAVYYGQSSGLQARLRSYINKNDTFGPLREKPFKLWAMVDLMSRGFSIQISYVETDSPEDCEKAALGQFNFPLNTRDNLHVRNIMVPSGTGTYKSARGFQVEKECLKAMAACLLKRLKDPMPCSLLAACKKKKKEKEACAKCDQADP